MLKMSLEALAREQSGRAASGSAGRSAVTVYGGHEHRLRQTLIALTRDSTLAEHESPGEATLYVYRGRVRMWAGDDSWEARTGDLLIIPPAPHGVDALEDSVVLLTVAVV